MLTPLRALLFYQIMQSKMSYDSGGYCISLIPLIMVIVRFSLDFDALCYWALQEKKMNSSGNRSFLYTFGGECFTSL